jgi:hypothetical protein
VFTTAHVEKTNMFLGYIMLQPTVVIIYGTCTAVSHNKRFVLKSVLPEIFYVQVTVHRDNLRINNQQDASSTQNFILSRNSTRFGHLLCPSSRVISCTRGNWYVSCRLCGCDHITCMKHTNCHLYS